MIAIILWGIVSFAGCQSVDGDRITAKDFARSVPEFAELPENLSLGFAPLPGAHRDFTGADIQRIAAQYGVKTDFHKSLCFEWPMHRLERGDVVKVMRETLGQDNVQLEEYSLFPAPPGQIVFPIAGLNRQTHGTSFWRGYVQYAGEKHFNIWAKVSLSGDAPTGARADVISGALVSVLVRSGAAELKLEGQAISSGSKGQMVTIRNPRSGRSFAAEVTGKDSVLVEAGELQK
jgi:hypothetical protein